MWGAGPGTIRPRMRTVIQWTRRGVHIKSEVWSGLLLTPERVGPDVGWNGVGFINAGVAERFQVVGIEERKWDAERFQIGIGGLRR